MFAQEGLGVLPALADALAVAGVPGARLLDDAGLHAEIEQLAGLGDALAVHDVELDHAERRRHLVLHHLHLGLVADHDVAVLDRADAANVQPDRGIELERVAAGRGLRAAEHHADLHAQLVDEDQHGVGFGDRTGQLPERLAHQAGLQAGQLVAHLAFQFGTRHQGRHGVHDQDVDGTGAYQSVGDLQGLLAGVGLRNQQLVDVDPELLGINRIERVLGVDEGAGAAVLLSLGHAVQRHRGLAGAFRAVDLHDPTARQAADAERDVEPQGAGRDHFGLDHPILAEAHDRALAEGLLDLAESRTECFFLVHAVPLDEPQDVLRHGVHSLSHRPQASATRRMYPFCSRRDKHFLEQSENNYLIFR